MEKPVLINTTRDWNVGDDLIRQGVLRLLGLENAPVLYVSRTQLGAGSDWVPAWKQIANIPSPAELVEMSGGFVVAGSPEWANQTWQFYNECLAQGKPITIVGAGGRQDRRQRPLLRQCRREGLLRATTRDGSARRYLWESGIAAPAYLDPAFFAGYPSVEKDLGLVVNYRAGGGNGRFDESLDPFWQKVAERFDSEIDLVTVHEPGEYLRAQRIFGERVFYSVEPDHYKAIYARTRVYLGGRIHGATPVLASGGTAYLAYQAAKVRTLTMWEQLETLKRIDYQTVPDSLPSIDGGETARFVAKQFNDYRQFLSVN